LHSTRADIECGLRAEVRTDTDGRFMGFRGVMLCHVPAPQAQVGEALAGVLAVSSVSPPAVSASQALESEQEALRYALSHDLRAPLRVVEGFTKIIKEDYGQALDRMGQDHLDRVLSAATRMHGMIDAILAQAQLAGAPLQRVPVDISALATDIGQDLAGTLPQRDAARLVVAEGMAIDADPQLVRRVLENLIGNAFKYSAKVAEPVVEVGMMPATNPCVFFVRDNGAGFDMQHADKLFGMFQRLHSAKEFPGTGVGLAGVQNIIRRHGGRVWAEAKPGEGACFYFTLMDGQTAQQQRGAR
jgi:light-regulated signal transduction histidine kinase (bacteriophytochrome)